MTAAAAAAAAAAASAAAAAPLLLLLMLLLLRWAVNGTFDKLADLAPIPVTMVARFKSLQFQRLINATMQT
jgi:hypothetical protein